MKFNTKSPVIFKTIQTTNFRVISSRLFHKIASNDATNNSIKILFVFILFQG